MACSCDVGPWAFLVELEMFLKPNAVSICFSSSSNTTDFLALSSFLLEGVKIPTSEGCWVFFAAPDFCLTVAVLLIGFVVLWGLSWISARSISYFRVFFRSRPLDRGWTVILSALSFTTSLVVTTSVSAGASSLVAGSPPERDFEVTPALCFLPPVATCL